MSSRHTLVRGAMILTAAGLISRLMGFFFRIFLSHAFGEESVGLYQLIFPVYALCLSLSTAGLQTAVSRITAAKVSVGKTKEARSVLHLALGLTLILSFMEIIIIQQNAEWIAQSFLGDSRCTQMLMIISYALPCAAVHSCICGYSLGLQKAELPAISQLIEQTGRILFVLLFFSLLKNAGQTPGIPLAAAGIVAGELLSALFSLHFLSRQKDALSGISPGISPSRKISRRYGAGAFTRLCEKISSCSSIIRELLGLSLPLTASRVTVTLLQSIEAASIPACLKLYGLSSSEALSLYGVLTGMAMPCILFPSALTGSVGTVLMPAVSATQAAGSRPGVIQLLKKAVGSCLILGLSCCLFFLVFGRFIGNVLFHSSSAGNFLLTLAWICPFLYTNTALISAINGLGKTTSTFLVNTAGLLVRIGGVFLAIPSFGIQGYLWGLLLSQFIVSILSVFVLVITGWRGTPSQRSGLHTAPE